MTEVRKLSSTATDVAELLEKAAEIIEIRGWCRGDLTKAGRVCAYGALNAAVFGTPGWWPAEVTTRQRELLSDAEEALGQAIMPAKYIDGWNDSQKSRKPIVAAFHQAARNIRGE